MNLDDQGIHNAYLLILSRFKTSAPAGAPFSSFAHFLGLGGAGQVIAPGGSYGEPG